MRALIIVDVQNDFLPGGTLAVSGGNDIVPIINSIQNEFDLVIATQDWHPANHSSFAANHPGKKLGDVIQLNEQSQVLWPVHCVQGTAGAEFSSSLSMNRVEAIFRKGTDPQIDSYSGFFDNGHRKSTGLAGYLIERGTPEIYVCGLATDYCVKFTALDAIGHGFTVHLIEDASRGVELNAGDAERAVEQMRAVGVKIDTSGSL
jgi:nicotinamidase/pyrazinamidase